MPKNEWYTGQGINRAKIVERQFANTSAWMDVCGLRDREMRSNAYIWQGESGSQHEMVLWGCIIFTHHSGSIPLILERRLVPELSKQAVTWYRFGYYEKTVNHLISYSFLRAAGTLISLHKDTGTGDMQITLEFPVVEGKRGVKGFWIRVIPSLAEKWGPSEIYRWGR